MTTIDTAYGTITKANSDFGYGFVTIEGDSIVYRDSTEWKSWKTAKGFEKWAAKMNKMCGGVFGEIRTREYEPTEKRFLAGRFGGIGMKTIYLKHHGEQKAIEVQDLKPGMVTMWNGGWTAEVAGVKTSKSGKTNQIVYADGRVDHRNVRTGRLVAIA